MKKMMAPAAVAVFIVILALPTANSAFQYGSYVVKDTRDEFVVEQEIVVENYDVETTKKLKDLPPQDKMPSHQSSPNWDDLDKRPLPKWFDEAKIGIFIHWGVFSVPSYRSEWFWADWKLRKFKNCVDFMKNNYRPGFTYADFAPQFTAEFFNADQWADIFNKSGAKYVVLTSKHHEGFTNWPSAYSYSWNSMDVGPKRDLVGELSTALRKKNLHVGLYHSLFEWFNPLYLEDKGYHFTTQSFVQQKAMPEMYELVNNYKPDVLWSDGDWEAPDTYWNSTHFLAWLYNDSPVKDTVVTNDRWGSGTMCKHGGYFTCHDRYNPGKLQPRKWENAMTIDSVSWGYRRNATLSEYITIEQLLGTLVETISCGGNILVNIGPSHDGLIHPIFQERLSQMGQWLGVNGEAIYSSSPWKYQNDTVTPKVWYTARPADSTVYAITLQWPENNNLLLGAPVPTEQTTVSLLGSHLALKWSKGKKGGMNIMIPPISYNQMPCKWVWVFRIRGLQNS